MKEAGIAELLDPAVDECDAQKQANREQRPAQPLGVQLARAVAADPGLTGRWRTIGSALWCHAQELGSWGCLLIYRARRVKSRKSPLEILNSRRPIGSSTRATR